jgi:hypothetical protein
MLCVTIRPGVHSESKDVALQTLAAIPDKYTPAMAATRSVAGVHPVHGRVFYERAENSVVPVVDCRGVGLGVASFAEVPRTDEGVLDRDVIGIDRDAPINPLTVDDSSGFRDPLITEDMFEIGLSGEDLGFRVTGTILHSGMGRPA